MKHTLMPGHHIRHYGFDGSLSMITPQPLTTASNMENPISITSTDSEAYTSVQANTGMNSLFTPQPNAETSSTGSNQFPAQCQRISPNPTREIFIMNDVTLMFVFPDQWEGNCNKMMELQILSTPFPSTLSPQVLKTMHIG